MAHILEGKADGKKSGTFSGFLRIGTPFSSVGKLSAIMWAA
jgi:hypothetical protein